MRSSSLAVLLFLSPVVIAQTEQARQPAPEISEVNAAMQAFVDAGDPTQGTQEQRRIGNAKDVSAGGK